MSSEDLSAVAESGGGQLLTVPELAAKLKVAETWIYSRTRFRSPNSLPCYRVGKYLRFDLREVLEWLKSQRQ